MSNSALVRKARISIFAMYCVGFIASFELVGAFLVPFFTEWGGISMFWALALQSWFKLSQMVLEIPTGLIGDVRGRKFSVLMGLVTIAVGSLLYSIVPNLGLFFIAETVYALGVAFISGSEDSMIVDAVKAKHGIKNGELSRDKRFEYESALNKVMSNFRIWHMAGYMASTMIFLVVDLSGVPLNFLFMSKVPLYLLGAILLHYLYTDFQKIGVSKNGISLKPDYIGTLKASIRVYRESSQLLRVSIFMVLSGGLGYYTIWLYQPYLELLGITFDRYPDYRIVLLLGQIGVLAVLPVMKDRVIPILCNRFRFNQASCSRGFLVVLVVVQLLVLGLSIVYVNLVSIILLLIVVGGLGNNLRSIYSADLNRNIPDEHRSTVLSLIQMVRSLLFVILNLIVGYFASESVIYGIACMFVLGLVLVLTIPKKSDFG